MKLFVNFFAWLTCVVFINTAAHGNDALRCASPEYRNAHPEKCASFSGATTIAPILGGVGVLGGALALIGMSAASASVSNANQPAAQPMSALPKYDTVGGDVESIKISAIMDSAQYRANFNQYNDIRLAYSIARGFTGRNTTIAVLDTGLDSWHGRNVAAMASGIIAPNATIESYKIAYDMEFVSYREIGDIIASANNANVFNASWSVDMRAPDLRSRTQLEQLTDTKFVSSISDAAINQDAIFVFAAGNDYDKSQSSALSAMPNVMPELHGHFINVVAWDSDTGALADYSNACGITQEWCITAPGSNINTGTSVADGTSFAAPIVSAAIAVIREAFPYMTASQITDLLFETARDLGEPGTDAIYGHGMLDMERATRPVGAPLVPVADGIMRPLQTARVSGNIAHQIRTAGLQFAYFDKYGRAFNTKLGDNISIQNPGRGFYRLRANDEITVFDMGRLKMGLMDTDFIFGDGFMKTNDNQKFGFIGTGHKFDIGNISLFHQARIGFGAPRASSDSMISHFSNIYTASIKLGAQFQDWTISVSVPDAIVSGTMGLRLPTGRAPNGNIIYNNYELDLRTQPAIEYSISYRALTASFIDNPFGQDEFFIMARGRIKF